MLSINSRFELGWELTRVSTLSKIDSLQVSFNCAPNTNQIHFRQSININMNYHFISIPNESTNEYLPMAVNLFLRTLLSGVAYLISLLLPLLNICCSLNICCYAKYYCWAGTITFLRTTGRSGAGGRMEVSWAKNTWEQWAKNK